MLPEKPWSCIHVNHTMNFMEYIWLVVIDSYTKYSCIHATQSISTNSTTDFLVQDFAHFGYPHTIVTDNTANYRWEEYQVYYKERGIVHLTGAPYYPATNGAAERLMQTFKQALRKSSKLLKKAVMEFLMQYRRTPMAVGYSSSELLNKRQLRTRIDTLLPSTVHDAQSLQSKQAVKSQEKMVKKIYTYEIGDPCFALYFGPRQNKHPCWVPAIVVKKRGTRSFHFRMIPKSPVWICHIDQLWPRYATIEEEEPGEVSSWENRPSTSRSATTSVEKGSVPTSHVDGGAPSRKQVQCGMTASDMPVYSRENLRRTQRQHKPMHRKLYCCWTLSGCVS